MAKPGSLEDLEKRKGAPKKNLRQAIAEELISEMRLIPEIINPDFIRNELQPRVKERLSLTNQNGALGRICADTPSLQVVSPQIWAEAKSPVPLSVVGDSIFTGRDLLVELAVRGIVARIIAILEPR